MEVLVYIWEFLLAEQFYMKVCLGAVFGLCLGLTGVGGGVMLIPMLQLFCGMSAVLAVGTASLISSLVKLNASVVHIRANNVSWRQILLMFVGALPLTIIVTQVVVHFNAHPDYAAQTQRVMSVAIIAVMVGALVSVMANMRKTQRPNDGVVESHVPKRKAILSGMFCGSVLGSTGVGGGVLLLPVLNSVLQVDIKKAVGSSVVLALSLSMVAALGYAKGGQSDTITALWFALGSLGGVSASSQLMARLSERAVYQITLSVIGLSLLLYLQV